MHKTFLSLLQLLAVASARPSGAPAFLTFRAPQDFPVAGLHERNQGHAPANSLWVTPKTGSPGNVPTKGLWFNPDLKAGASTSHSTKAYECFNGNVAKYPSLDQWLSFDDIWSVNEPTLLTINSPENVQHLRDGILEVSKEAEVDPRFIFAMVLQESSGRVDVHCTQGASHRNCGLLQASVGSTSLDPSNPKESIKQMLREGIQGTGKGAGLAQYMQVGPDLAYTNNKWTGNPFTAARAYNSGRIAASGNLDEASSGTTSAYTNDIANRLLGWDGSGMGCAQAKCGLSTATGCSS